MLSSWVDKRLLPRLDAQNAVPNLLVFQPFARKRKASWLVNDAILHSFTYTPDAAQSLVQLVGRHNREYRSPLLVIPSEVHRPARSGEARIFMRHSRSGSGAASRWARSGASAARRPSSWRIWSSDTFLDSIPRSTTVLEKLDGSLVLLRRLPRLESA